MAVSRRVQLIASILATTLGILTLTLFRDLAFDAMYFQVPDALLVSARCDRRSSHQSDLVVTVRYNSSLVAGEQTARFVQSSITGTECRKRLLLISSVGQRVDIVVSRDDVSEVASANDVPSMVGYDPLFVLFGVVLAIMGGISFCHLAKTACESPLIEGVANTRTARASQIGPGRRESVRINVRPAEPRTREALV